MSSEGGDGVVRHALLINGEGITIQDAVAAAVAAERAGFDTVWHAEDRCEPWVPLAAIAMATSRVRLGSAVAIIARPPMFMEQAAASIDELSGGRALLGLGTGPRERTEHWHGLDPTRPALRTREYVAAVREMWTAHSGRTVSYEGKLIRIRDYERARAPLRERVPIFMSGSGPMMLEAGGELGDAIMFDVLTTPLLLPELKQLVEVGLQRSGRAWENIERGCVVTVAVNEDRSVAFDLARHQLAYYLQFPQLDELVEQHGLADDAAAMRRARDLGDEPGMIAAVTDGMVEAFTLSGTPDEVRERLGEWTSFIDMPMLFSPSWRLSREQILDNQLAIIKAFSA